MCERNGRRRALIGVLAILLTVGCADRSIEGTIGLSSLRDSAGVVIVSNGDEGLWTTEDQWRVEEDLRIGTAGGDPNYQFGLVGGIAELTDGTLVVLDRFAQHLRVFSASGEYLRTVGGPGAGPGEFGVNAGPVLVGPGDTILVPDIQNLRVNRFTPTVQPAGSSRFDMSRGFPAAWSDTPDGRIISHIRPVAIPDQPGADSMDLVFVRGSDGGVSDTFPRLRPGHTFEQRDGTLHYTYFSPRPIWAMTTGGSFVVGRNDAYRLRIHEGSTLVRIIEKTNQTNLLTEADRTLIRSGLVRTFEERGLGGPDLAAFRDAIGFTDTYPAFYAIEGGPNGSIWVQQFQLARELPSEELRTFDDYQLFTRSLGFASPTWDVFDGKGRFLGEVETPRGYTPMRFKGDRIYGIWRDELEIEYVLILRVVYPGEVR